MDLFSAHDGSAFEERAAKTPILAPDAPAASGADLDAPTQLTQPLRADAHEIVVSLLGPAPVLVDDLIRVAGLTAREVQGVLVELDVEGRLQRHGANRVSLVYNQKL